MLGTSGAFSNQNFFQVDSSLAGALFGGSTFAANTVLAVVLGCRVHGRTQSDTLKRWHHVFS